MNKTPREALTSARGFHLDRRVQYASYEYTDLLKEHGFRISMSQAGSPFDKAMVEGVFKTLKSEKVYLWDYQTLADVEKGIPYFMEEVYDQKLLNSSLGYLSSNEFEQMLSEHQYPIESCQITLTRSVRTKGCNPASF